MSKRNTKNSTPQLRNFVTAGIYGDFLYQIARSIIKIDGLPFDDPDVCRHAENVLKEKFIFGMPVGLTKSDRVEGAYLIGGCTGSDGVTWYGGHTQFVVNTYTDSFTRDISEIAILSPAELPGTNYKYMPVISLINHFAGMLYECDNAISTNIKGQHTPAVIMAPHGQELTYANIYEQIAGHKAVVYGYEDLMEDPAGQSHDIRGLVYHNPAPFVAGSVEGVKNALISDFCFMIGLSNRSVTKAAQVSVEEINKDTSVLSVLRNANMALWESFAEQCARKLGLDVSISFNDDFIGDISLINLDATEEETEVKEVTEYD